MGKIGWFQTAKKRHCDYISMNTLFTTTNKPFYNIMWGHTTITTTLTITHDYDVYDDYKWIQTELWWVSKNNPDRTLPEQLIDEYVTSDQWHTDSDHSDEEIVSHSIGTCKWYD